MDWNEDTPELLLDYHMFHRWYEVKIIKSKLVIQANDAKKAENEAIREKQRKEWNRLLLLTPCDIMNKLLL